MAADFPEIAIRDYSSLVDALRAVKDHLQISNETLENICGVCPGFIDKVLGPSRVKKIGPNSLGLLLGGLGVRLRVEIDPEQSRRLAHRWEKRNAIQLREHTRLSKQILELARPIIFRELTRNATIASALARRRRAKDGNGQANGQATER